MSKIREYIVKVVAMIGYISRYISSWLPTPVGCAFNAFSEKVLSPLDSTVKICQTVALAIFTLYSDRKEKNNCSSYRHLKTCIENVQEILGGRIKKYPEKVKGNLETEVAKRTIFPNKNYIFIQSQDPKKTIKALELAKRPIYEMNLCSLSNELLAFIAANFKELKTLRLKPSCSVYYNQQNPHAKDFTQSGLLEICKFLELKCLEIDAFFCKDIMDNGIEEILQNTYFKEHLKIFIYRNRFLNYKECISLMEYKKLVHLVIPGRVCGKDNAMANEYLIALLASTSLQSSLKSLSLEYMQPLNINLSRSLTEVVSNYKNLEEFFLCPTATFAEELSQLKCLEYYKFSADHIQKLLLSQKNLKKLMLGCVAIDDSICFAVQFLNNLQELHLRDCSAVTMQGFQSVFKNAHALTKLSLGRVAIDKLPSFENNCNLTEISLTQIRGSIDWNSVFSAKNFKKKLKSLAIIDSNLSSEDFMFLGKLQALESLKIDRCPWFNDDALKSMILFSKNSNIENLILSHLSITKKSLKYLEKMHRLKCLALAGCYSWTKKGFASLFESKILQKNLHLFVTDYKYLNVSSLPKLSSLKAVCYQNDSISEEVAKCLFIEAHKNGWSLNVKKVSSSFFLMAAFTDLLNAKYKEEIV